MGLDGGETLPEPNTGLNILGMLGRMLRRFGRGLTVLPAFYPTYETQHMFEHLGDVG